MNHKLKKGGYMAVFSILVIAAVILVNLLAGKIPAKYRRLDLSSSQIYSLSGTTTDILDHLTEDVTIDIVGNPDSIDERITNFAQLYSDRSDRVTVTLQDSVLHPDILTSLDTQPNTILVRCPATGKKQSIAFSDIIQIDLAAYYQYGQYKETGFDGEGQLTGAIAYVTSDSSARAYTLKGHGESALGTMVQDSFSKSSMETEDLDLLKAGAIPEDCDLLIINNPQSDIAADEKTLISDYLKSGGHVIILAGCTGEELSNLNGLMADYGIRFLNGYVADTAPQHFYSNNPFIVIPEYDYSSGLLEGVGSGTPALLMNPAGLSIQEDLREGLEVMPVMTTSDQGILVDPATQEQTEGTYVLAAAATEPVSSPAEPEEGTASEASEAPTSSLIVIAAPALTEDTLLSSFPSIGNLSIFMNAAAYGQEDVTTVSIPAKSLEVSYNMITAGGLWSALFIIVIPIIFLIAGFVIWMRRRKL